MFTSWKPKHFALHFQGYFFLQLSTNVYSLPKKMHSVNYELHVFTRHTENYFCSDKIYRINRWNIWFTFSEILNAPINRILQSFAITEAINHIFFKIVFLKLFIFNSLGNGKKFSIKIIAPTHLWKYVFIFRVPFYQSCFCYMKHKYWDAPM